MLDPLTISLIANVITSASIGILSTYARNESEAKLRFDQLRSEVKNRESLRQAIDAGADNLRTKVPAQLHAFLEFDAVKAALWSHFNAQLMGGDTEAIAREIVEVATSCFSIEESKAQSLWTFLISETSNALRDLAQQGFGYAREHLDEQRNATILRQLEAIQHGLASLRPARNGRIHLASYVEQYRVNASAYFSEFSLPHLARTEHVQLNDIFVPPNISLAPDFDTTSTEQDVQQPLGMIGTPGRRSVLLGEPGGGKSTFGRRLCLQAAAESENEGDSGLGLPLFAKLRDYASPDAKPNLVAFLFDHCTHATGIDRAQFESLLSLGSYMVVLDGLDEVPLNRRHWVTTAVKRFVTKYPATGVLLTCRTQSYAFASLSRSMFTHYRLKPLTARSAELYVKNWFRVKGLKRRQIDSRFMSLSAELARIGVDAGNPLLLSLICGLASAGYTIPMSRASIYRQCAEAYLTRDTHRDLETQDLKALAGHIRPLLERIAGTIILERPHERSISRREIESTLTGYLEKFFPQHEVAGANAELLKFFQERAWMLRAAEDGSVFFFTHETFLEYFGGCSLASDARGSVDRIAGSLSARIEQLGATSVEEIAAHFFAGENYQQANRLVESLLKLSYEKRRKSDDVGGSALGGKQARLDRIVSQELLLFVARCMEDFVLESKLIEHVIDYLFDELRRTGRTRDAEGRKLLDHARATSEGQDSSSALIAAVRALAMSRPENAGSISRRICQSLFETVSSYARYDRVTGAKTLIVISKVLSEMRSVHGDHHVTTQVVSEALREWSQEQQVLIAAANGESEAASAELVIDGEMGVPEFVLRWGVDGLTKRRWSLLHVDIDSRSLLVWAVRSMALHAESNSTDSRSTTKSKWNVAISLVEVFGESVLAGPLTGKVDADIGQYGFGEHIFDILVKIGCAGHDTSLPPQVRRATRATQIGLFAIGMLHCERCQYLNKTTAPTRLYTRLNKGQSGTGTLALDVYLLLEARGRSAADKSLLLSRMSSWPQLDLPERAFLNDWCCGTRVVWKPSDE